MILSVFPHSPLLPIQLNHSKQNLTVDISGLAMHHAALPVSMLWIPQHVMCMQCDGVGDTSAFDAVRHIPECDCCCGSLNIPDCDCCCDTVHFPEYDCG